MYNFTYSIPTTVNFGKDQISHLSELKNYGDNVLLVYGGGSIKKTGLYDKIISIMKQNNINVTELSGVEPNPRIQTVRKGVLLCKDNKIDIVLAVGGGSTIDCSKIVAAGSKYDGDPWDLVIDAGKIKQALPIFTVLTLAATGSEMDGIAVISDMTKNEKWGTGGECIKPKMSIIDPTLTFSVSQRQTASGTADIMSHTFENYFTKVTGADLQGYMCEAILKTLIKNGPIAIENPEDYDARANLAWCSSLAINGLVQYGSAMKWTVHPMEHELSAFYDITHGEGLAILTPPWMERCMKTDPTTIPIFAKYGRNVWGISDNNDNTAAEKAVAKLKEWLFNTMKLPSNLRSVGIKEKCNFEKMAEKAAKGCVGGFVELSKADIIAIFEAAF